MKKIRLLPLIALIAACSAGQAAAQQAAQEARRSAATAAPDHVVLSWTGDPATSMTVTWRTDTTVGAGVVQYHLAPIGGAALEAEAAAREFESDLGPSRIFSATMTGLSPGTAYVYRVGDGTRWSAWRPFRTADPQAAAFKFLVFGDSQSPVRGDDPYGLWRKTLHGAFGAHPDAAFTVHVGDLVDYGQSEEHWNAWFAASGGVVDTLPAMVMTGNHESYGMMRIGRPEFFTRQFSLPPNGPATLANQAYSFDYGPVHIVVLDSQGAEQRKYGDILSIEQSWLASDLHRSDAAWNLAFFHRSPYGVKPDRDESEVREAFCPILERYGVRLVFTAHDHGVKRTVPLRDGSPVDDPLRGTTYYITGRSGAKTYDDIEPMQHSAYFYDPSELPNYLVVEGTDRKITVTAYLQDGTVLDAYSIEKPDGGPTAGSPPAGF